MIKVREVVELFDGNDEFLGTSNYVVIEDVHLYNQAILGKILCLNRDSKGVEIKSGPNGKGITEMFWFQPA